MTLQELLKSKELTDEQITGIMADMKKNKIYTSGEENLDIRYGKLKNDFETLTNEHGESTKLIEKLKNSQKDDEAAQNQIKEYEKKVNQLQSELDQTKKDGAMKVALLGAGVKESDIDYISFQIQKKGTEIKLDDNGEIKGMTDIISGLKTQYPNQFETSSNKKVEEKKLTDPDSKPNGITKADFLKKSYSERLQYKQDNPEGFKELENS